VLAASVLELLTSPELLAKAKDQFRQDIKDTSYFSLLPSDAKPPLDLNREMMTVPPGDAQVLPQQEAELQLTCHARQA